MGYLLPVAIGAGLIGLFAYKKSTEGKGQQVPMGMASVPLGQAAQQAAFVKDPISSAMSTADVQKALNQLGASPQLAVDGSQGPKTTAAIKSFQAQAGLTADGVAGPQTASALRLALGSPAGSAVMGSWLCIDPHDGQQLPAHYVGGGDPNDPDLLDPELASPHTDAVIALHDFGADDLANALASGDPSAVDDAIVALHDFGADDLANALAMQHGHASPTEAEAVPFTGCGPGVSYAGQVPGEHAPPCSPSELFDQTRNKCVPFWPEGSDAGDGDPEYAGQQDWSAPDIGEALADPAQRAQIYYQQQWAERAQEAFPEEALQEVVSPFGIPGMRGVQASMYVPQLSAPGGYYAQPSEYSPWNVEGVSAQGVEFATRPGADVRL
ncbi:MAG: peptidoglycan-binding protein [Polyangiales bacterium]